jgi:hypothetical protein
MLDPPGNGAVWAWDRGLQRITRIEPQPISDYEVEVIRLEGGPHVQRAVRLDNGDIVGLAHSEEERVVVFSATGRFEHSLSGHLLGPEEASHSERLRATNSGIVVRVWKGRGFVVANIMAGRLEIYDMGARLVRLAEVPYPSEPRFETFAPGELRVTGPRKWYYDCTATQDLLFALFSGRLESAFDGDERFASQFVHVFDWAGALIAVFELDKSVAGIGVDPSGRVLYAGSAIDSRVYRYSLPPLSPSGDG